MRPALPRPLLLAASLAGLALLAGCDQLGIETASTTAAKREAEGKAIGGACRHAGRALEDCYALNKRADKGAVFSGWREMNDYMRENKIAEVAPQLANGAENKPAEDGAEEEVEEPAPKAKGAKADKASKASKAGKHG